MARPKAPKPVKLLVGLLGSDVDLLRRARQLLTKQYGPVDLESSIWPFDQTDYYEAEMGPDLRRWFLTFVEPISPEQIAEIKRSTNELEERIAGDALLPDIARPVNIDPGYLNLHKLVLATTKDAGHRIYLGRGIYAEVTLRFANGAWRAHPWTYPDYQRAEALEFFATARDQYKDDPRVRPNVSDPDA